MAIVTTPCDLGIFDVQGTVPHLHGDGQMEPFATERQWFTVLWAAVSSISVDVDVTGRYAVVNDEPGVDKAKISKLYYA